MTRLDASNEPSMEDILASIRKIIAEDPPGSRPAPTNAPVMRAAAPVQSHSPFSKAPVRDPIFETQPVAAPATTLAPAASPSAASPSPVTPEPYLRASPAKPDLSAFSPAPFMPKAAAPAPVNARIEPSFAAPSFAAMSAPAPAVVAVTAERAPAALTQPPEATPAAALSVDAQLSELLGDMVPPKALSPAVPAAAVQSAPAAAEAVAPQVDIADQSIAMPFLPNPPVPAEARPAESRPGFKVSRDGYVAEKAEVSVARDPFDFDLGPSPFVKKTEEAKRTGQNAGDVKEAEPQTLAAVPPAPVFDLSALSLEHEARPAAALEMAPMAAPVVAFEMPVPSAATRFEMPSVAATLAPPVSVPSTPEPAPVSPVDVAAVDTAVEAPLIEEPEVVLEETLEAPAAPAPESFESSPSPEFAPPVNSMVVHDHHRNSRLPPADLGQRTMEDAVADLLRPMLKTWLAENMPRIVERALRRELTDQLQSEHKSAAE